MLTLNIFVYLLKSFINQKHLTDVMELSIARKNALFAKVFVTHPRFKLLPLKFHKYLSKIMKYEKVLKKNDKYYILSQMPPYPSKAFDRYVDGLVSVSEGKHRPISLEFAITNRCPCKCWHCSNALREGKDIPLNKIKEMMRGFIDLGVTWIGLSGGEPLMRKDLEKIISVSKGDATIALFTTGVSLTKERALKLKKAGLDSFVISLDSTKEKIHDELRGYKGAYKAALKAIKISNEIGLYTVVSTVGTRTNVSTGEMEKFLKWCKRKHVDEVRILALAASGKLISGTDETLRPQDVKKLNKLHKDGNRSSKFPKVMAFPYLEGPDILGCAGGYQHFTIDAQGNVCPCPFLPMGVGNAANDGAEAVWKRYKNLFQRPHAECINSRSYKEIHKSCGGELPLGPKESAKIYKTLDPGVMPGFYKALIKKK